MLTQSDKAQKVKQVYHELDRKFEEETVEKTALKLRVSYMSLYHFPIDQGVLGLIKKDIAQSLGVVAFHKEGRNVKLGILGQSPQLTQFIAELKSKSLHVQVFLISKSSFNHALALYDRIVEGHQSSSEINIGNKVDEVNLSSLKDLGSKLVELSPTEIVRLILGAALPLNVSDIHIEPNLDQVKIRFRVDGVLQDVSSVDLNLHHQLVSRIKVLGKMKLNVVNTPQDGSFSLTYNNSPVDVRVSILPSAFGESLVMRVLRQDKQNLDFDELGISALASEQLSVQMRKPNGMVLTTGPTGSGKTTTLYAILNKLNEPGVKIITLEEPVEYKLSGITQTPINKNEGMTFVTTLRAVLRQDPDVIMVGEMRDLETVETAAHAALTGHVVLSTLHTNDAASAIPRLLDLGVKPFVLAPAVNAIVGQRLVRKICQHCKQEYKPSKQLLQRVEMILHKLPKQAQIKVPAEKVFYHSVGCAVCKGLGYNGRVGVFEVFVVNEAIEKLIHAQAITTDIKKQAVSDGMVTMAQDGLLKALAGITDVEEVFRVTEE